MNMKLRNIPFSPPDMTEAEAKEVREAILSEDARGQVSGICLN